MGYNGDGQLGNGTTTNSSTPVPVSGLAASAITLGQYHSCAVQTDGQVSCWGTNWEGELGDGSGTTSQVTPNRVGGLQGLQIASLSAVTGLVTCATTANTDVYCWGYGEGGAIGDGTINSAFLPFGRSSNKRPGGTRVRSAPQ